MSHIKRKSEILLLRPRQSAEIVKLMEEFRGLFKTIAFLTFSGVLEVIKVQEIFLKIFPGHGHYSTTLHCTPLHSTPPAARWENLIFQLNPRRAENAFPFGA